MNTGNHKRLHWLFGTLGVLWVITISVILYNGDYGVALVFAGIFLLGMLRGFIRRKGWLRV